MHADLTNDSDPQQVTERLKFAMAAAQLGDWSWDAASDIVSLSPQGAAIFGVPEGQPITWASLRSLLDQEDSERARLAVEHSLASHVDYNVEYRVNRPDGKRVWVAAQGKGVYALDGTVKGMIGVVGDITERKADEEIRNRLAAIVESSDDAIISKTLDGIIRTWNKGAERIFGYTADEAIGQSIMILIPEGRKHEEDDILAGLRRGERVDHFETERLHKDGRKLHISLSVSPVKGAYGQIIGAAKIARDITAQKLGEQALREEKRVSELLNQTGAILGSTLDIEKLVQAITNVATRISGAEFGAFFYNITDDLGDAYHLDSLFGAPPEAYEKLDPPRVTPLFGPTFKGEKPIRIANVLEDPLYGQRGPHYGMPPGHLPVCSYLAVPVVSRSGEVIGSLLFGHSLPGVFTERAEKIVLAIAAQAAMAIDNARLYEKVRSAAEERVELLEAERAARADAERMNLMKDEFLATLSHELRTPLNAILGWTQVLAMSEPPNDEYREGLEVIERNARAQTQLIADLLDMSRIISGKIRLDVQATELAPVVEAAVEAVRPSAEAKGIALRTILDPLAGPVTGDSTRLQQVMWNLLTNAIKFTPKGGKVDVLLERVNSHLEITVHDTGIGIEAEFLPMVFERFRQADASTSRSYGGLGIGLSIVKSLIELHGGTVRVKSPGKDQGTTFTVALPLAPLRGAELREHPTRSTSGYINCETANLAGVKIVVVDDDPDARSLIKRVLVQCEAEVITASTADEGMTLIKQHKPNVLISDIGMPHVDGYQFLKQVRKLSADVGGRTPAIALTAFARSEDRTRALLAGYQIHIAKPIETQELLATVASLAGRTM
jgi:PAS domain S-box-containing protein